MRRHTLRTASLDPKKALLQKRVSGAPTWERWLEESDRLASDIRSRRGGDDLPVDELLRQSRQDLEHRGE